MCGSRVWRNRLQLEKTLDEYTLKETKIHMFTGGAAGADRMAEDWWDKNKSREGVPCVLTIIPANWMKFGKAAGPMRNQKLADKVGAHGLCLAFRSDGISNGTDDMIRKAQLKGMRVIIFREEELWQTRFLI